MPNSRDRRPRQVQGAAGSTKSDILLSAPHAAPKEEERRTTQTVRPTLSRGTPVRSQKEQHSQKRVSWAVKLAIALLSTLAVSLLILFFEKQSEYNALKITNGVQEKKIERLESRLKATLKQYQILARLGPDVVSFQRLTVGKDGEVRQIHVGHCPALPCYTLTYGGMKVGEKESELDWQLDGESGGQDTSRMKGTHVLFPARSACYGKVVLPNNYTILLVLERLLTPETFDVTVGMVRTNATASPSSQETTVSPVSSAGCFDE